MKREPTFYIKRSIPNIITCLNILSGCLSIVLAFEGNLFYAAILILISAFLDFADGQSARMLGAYTRIGKELDSLADIVSFGLAPSVIMYELLKVTLRTEGLLFRIQYPESLEILILMSAFVITVFSALRLAKFNLDTRQSEHFIGLPVPANALFIAGLPLILLRSNYDFLKEEVILNLYFLLFIIFIGSYLLVSEITMFSLKFKDLGLKGNIIRYVFLLLAVVLLIFFKFLGLPLIIMLYFLISLSFHILQKKFPRQFNSIP